MKSTFEWTLTDGRSAKLEAEYSCTMQSEIMYADGYNIPAAPKPGATDCNMIAYIDGAQVASSHDPNFWQLIDAPKRPGFRIIGGLKVGFPVETAARYEQWLAELIEAGTTDEVKAYLAEKQKKKDAEACAAAKALIEKAEKQGKIPSEREARRMMEEYNNIHNDGGYGFVPHIISREEYDAAKRVLAERSRNHDA